MLVSCFNENVYIVPLDKTFCYLFSEHYLDFFLSNDISVRIGILEPNHIPRKSKLTETSMSEQ